MKIKQIQWHLVIASLYINTLQDIATVCECTVTLITLLTLLGITIPPLVTIFINNVGCRYNSVSLKVQDFEIATIIVLKNYLIIYFYCDFTLDSPPMVNVKLPNTYVNKTVCHLLLIKSPGNVSSKSLLLIFAINFRPASFSSSAIKFSLYFWENNSPPKSK